MDIAGVDRFWLKTMINAESGYEAERAKQMMGALRRFQVAQGIDAVEVLRNS